MIQQASVTGTVNSFTHSFNHLFRKHTLNSFYMLITELGTGDINIVMVPSSPFPVCVCFAYSDWVTTHDANFSERFYIVKGHCYTFHLPFQSSEKCASVHVDHEIGVHTFFFCFAVQTFCVK